MLLLSSQSLISCYTCQKEKEDLRNTLANKQVCKIRCFLNASVGWVGEYYQTLKNQCTTYIQNLLELSNYFQPNSLDISLSFRRNSVKLSKTKQLRFFEVYAPHSSGHSKNKTLQTINLPFFILLSLFLRGHFVITLKRPFQFTGLFQDDPKVIGLFSQ